MRREGSPFTGLGAVLGKELADHLSSIRMRILELVLMAFCALPLGFLIARLRDISGGEDRFLLLYLFSLSSERVPLSLFQVLEIALPVLAIGLGFDSVNSEFNRRTMSRILAQPVYRDAVLLGKFFAGVMTLAITLLILWLLVVGAGILTLGVAPTMEELGRSLIFMIGALAFASVWLAVAMLFSTLFNSAAASVICSLGVWLFFWHIWPLLATGIAEGLVPATPHVLTSPQAMIDYVTERTDIEQLVTRFSPSTLYSEAALGILAPGTRTLQNSTNLLQQAIPALRGGAILGAPLSFGESVLLIWPNLVALISATLMLLVATYIIFQRQEVRA